MKLVSCIAGEVHSVIVDLRKDSSTFLQWHSERLSLDNCRALLVPEGCAHGFQAVRAPAVVVYCHSMHFNPAAEGGLHPQDPGLAIEWPLPISRMSERDASYAYLDSDFRGVEL